MRVSKRINENEIIIYLEGRLDTTTAPILEEELENITEPKNLVFDFENLEYISSAGLRLILKAKKQTETVKVINCNPEVYEIFNMTGFAEIMDVTKALREVSIDECEVIGEGFYGTVYRLDQETIVKVYKEGYSIESVKREIDLARKAFVLGIPTAIPYDIVKVGNLYGSVFELLNSKSLQKRIVEGADVDKIVRDTVEILKKMHNTVIKNNELPSKKERIIELANDCKPYLPDEIWKKLIYLIESVPETNTMIHGDFHIKNIMEQNDEILLIDMDTISVGHPIFELGAIYATYEGFACVNKNNTQEFLGITLEQSKKILDLTYKYYFDDKSSEYIEEIMNKAKVIAYLQVLWLKQKFLEENNEVQKQEIEFCKNYFINNLSNIDSLAF